MLESKSVKSSPTNLAIATPTANKMTATITFGIAANTWFSTPTIGREIVWIFNVSKAIVTIGIKMMMYTMFPNTLAIVVFWPAEGAASKADLEVVSLETHLSTSNVNAKL